MFRFLRRGLAKSLRMAEAVTVIAGEAPPHAPLLVALGHSSSLADGAAVA